jgi:hypothetical protein
MRAAGAEPASDQAVEDGHALVCANPPGLKSIHSPAVNLVRWRRQAAAALIDLLDDLEPAELPRLRLEQVPRATVRQRFEGYFDHDAVVFAPLIDDVVQLSDLFSELAGASRIDLRREAIEGDACRKFHADVVRLRLLCTYLGPATQWVPSAAVKWDDQGAVLGVDEAQVRSLARFEVGVLKGRLLAASGHPPAVHRSPPIASTGTTRLLLRINEPQDP